MPGVWVSKKDARRAAEIVAANADEGGNIPHYLKMGIQQALDSVANRSSARPQVLIEFFYWLHLKCPMAVSNFYNPLEHSDG